MLQAGHRPNICKEGKGVEKEGVEQGDELIVFWRVGRAKQKGVLVFDCKDVNVGDG